MRALAIDSGNPNAVSALGFAHLKAGRFTDAAAVYRRALAMVPDDLGIYSNLGAAYSRSATCETRSAVSATRDARSGTRAWLRAFERSAGRCRVPDEASRNGCACAVVRADARVAQLPLVLPRSAGGA